VRVALKAAGKPTDTRVDTELARELAYRRSVRAVLEGTVGRLGKGYSIVLRVVDVDSARVLLTQSGTARDDDDLILTVDGMARKLRKGLGENRQGLKATRSMNVVATPSFEAYRLFVESGARFRTRTSESERLNFMRAAVALDSGFVAAWFTMAFSHTNRGHPDSARMCLKEVQRYPDRAGPGMLNEVTRWLMEMDGNREGYLAEIDRMVAENPDNMRALALGNDALWRAGRFEDALDRGRRLRKLKPFGPTDGDWVNESISLILLGRFDEAREATRQQTGILKLPLRAVVELTDGRFAAAESIAFRHLDDPLLGQDWPDGMRSHLAEARFGRGDLAGAATMLREGAERCRGAHDAPSLDWYRSFAREVGILSGMAFPAPSALAGPDTTAQSLLDRAYEAVLVRDTTLARRCLRALRGRPPIERADRKCLPIVLEARLEAMAGRPQEAVRLLRAAVIRWPEMEVVTTAILRWWLADAYMQLGQPDSAAVALERGGGVSYPNGRDRIELPFVHHRLALLHASRGRVADAERHLKAAEHDWDRPDASVRRKLDEARAAIQVARGMSRPQG
jgi:tetratricopeptide (TPR) repeat protein